MVIVQWLSVEMENGHWNVVPALFRTGGISYASPHDPVSMTHWEEGFGLLAGSGSTTLACLVALSVLNLVKTIRRFPWFVSFLVLSSVIFDQILYTFSGPKAEALSSAVEMGANPSFFKGLVVLIILLQGWLFIRFGIKYRGKQASNEIR